MALFTNKQFAFLVLVAVVLGLLTYFKGKRAVQAINPTNPYNIFNQAFEWLYDGGFDGKGSPGSDAYELIHEDIPAALDQVDPTNHDNIVNRNAVALYQWLTGSDGTPGGDLAGWVHRD